MREVRTWERLLNGGMVAGQAFSEKSFGELEGFLELFSVQSCRVQVVGVMKVFWPMCFATGALDRFISSRLS